MADAIQNIPGTNNGWDDLRQLFIDNGLRELADVITNSVQENGTGSDALIYEDLRKSQPYRERFKGNFDRVAAGKNWLSEGTYLYQEQMYGETLASHQAGDLATRDNYAKFIAGDVSVNELSDRFTAAYDRVQAAVNSNDKPFVDELRKMYPGVTDQEIAKSLLMGKEGSAYLKNKIDVASVNAAQTEAGMKSQLGSEFLVSQGISRAEARAGLAKTNEQLLGTTLAAQTYGENPEDIQTELERENLLGQQSNKAKRLNSQARAQFNATSGTAAGSFGSSKAGLI